MASSTFIAVPLDVTDGPTLRRFLETLIQRIDVAFGNRGTDAFTTEKQFNSTINSVNSTINGLIEEDKTFVKLDGSRLITGPLKYDNFNSVDDYDLANIKWITDKGYTSNPKQSTITEMGLVATTRGLSYNQVEAQQVADDLKLVADKLDVVINSLKLANIIS